MRLTRRSLIGGFSLALGLDRPSLARWLGGRARAVGATLGQAQPAAAPTTLSGAELEDLLAFAELLVEGRPLSPAERAPLVEHIEERAKQGSGYYLELYRTTVGLLDRVAGGGFSGLEVAQRIALMTRHRLTSSDVRPRENLGAFPDAVRAVRTRAVPDLIGGYYGSSRGRAVAGYDVFPGRCGSLARYTGPEP